MRLKKQCHSVCFLFVSGIVTVALQRIDELAKLNATSRMVGISYPKYQFVADSSQEKQGNHRTCITPYNAVNIRMSIIR